MVQYLPRFEKRKDVLRCNRSIRDQRSTIPLNTWEKLLDNQSQAIKKTIKIKKSIEEKPGQKKPVGEHWIHLQVELILNNHNNYGFK